MGILIIGHAQHGKDTVAEMIREKIGLEFKSSSIAAAEIFLFDALKDKYGYSSHMQCYEDRVNHRIEWFDLIVDYNKEDRARLAKDILKNSDIYVGMRDVEELEECQNQGLFKTIIGVYDPRKPLEHPLSFNIDLWDESDFVIPNSSSLESLSSKIDKILPLLKP
jgi:dephospho-CoA kinase